MLSLSVCSAERAGNLLRRCRVRDEQWMALSPEQLLEVNVDKVYGASKYEQKVSQAPASVSLVTREETKAGIARWQMCCAV